MWLHGEVGALLASVGSDTLVSFPGSLICLRLAQPPRDALGLAILKDTAFTGCALNRSAAIIVALSLYTDTAGTTEDPRTGVSVAETHATALSLWTLHARARCFNTAPSFAAGPKGAGALGAAPDTFCGCTIIRGATEEALRTLKL